MTLLLWSLIAAFSLCSVAYLYRHKRQLFRLKKQFIDLNHTLEQSQQEIKSLQIQLHESSQDPITHVLTRSIFEDRLSLCIKEGERYQLTTGILLVDIDDFKTINHVLGTQVGDDVLRAVAERIQASIRKVDSVCRFSKDTFVVLLSQISKPEMAALVAQRILQALSEPIEVNEQEIYLTTSIGIAISPADGNDVVTLLDHGQHALTLAKKQANHSYQFYQEKLHVESERELLLHTSISRDAILKELSLQYLPIRNIQTHSLAGLEAQLRWIHPVLGLIHPREIFNLAIKQHKLNDITEWMIRTACQTFLKYRELDATISFLSIPVSIKQLENSHFIYRISQLLQEASFNPEWLVLELQHSGHPSSMDVLEKAFNMLQYLRIHVAMNHVGSDAFSLRYLKNFPIRYLMIDRLLIDDIDLNKKSLILVKSIIFMAKSLSMQVVAQDVDAKQQFDQLKDLGCSLLAGSFISAPQTEEELLVKVPSSIA